MSMKPILFVALFGVLFVAEARAQDSWTSRATNSYSFSEGGGCSDGTYLYYMAGWHGTSEENNGTFRFHPLSNTWSELATMPSGTRFPAVAHHNGAIYLFGDWGRETGDAYKYDIASNSWSALGIQTTHMYMMNASTSGNYVYVIGGIDVNYQYSTSVTRYDPATNTIAPMTSLPSHMRRQAQATLTSTGKIYIVGSWDFRRRCWEYDPTGAPGGLWTVKANAMTDWCDAAAFVVKNRLFCVGGVGIGGGRLCHEFDPNAGPAGLWRPRASTAVAYRNFPGAGSVGRKGYVWIGTDCEEYAPLKYGHDPHPATNVRQVGPRGDLPQGGENFDLGWTTEAITFQADLSHVDNRPCALEVQVKRAASPWTDQPVVSSSLIATPGMASLVYAIPSGGEYDWRYRVRDQDDNFAPGTGGADEWTEFNDNLVSPDFRSDQIRPAPPTAIAPDRWAMIPTGKTEGDVPFTWRAPSDNAPVSGMTFDLQVSFDASFATTVQEASGVRGTGHVLVLQVTATPYHWRVRAIDIGGNVGEWGTPRWFRVVPDDGRDNAGGDAVKVCGFGASATRGMEILLVLVLVAWTGGRKLVR